MTISITSITYNFPTFRLWLFSLLLLVSYSSNATLTLDFSHERGYYDSPFQLTITASDPTATIQYTTDKSKPNFSNGNIYTGPITISDITNLRVFAYLPAESTPVIAHSYIFTNSAIAQGDSYIINSGTYSGLMESSYEALPVISITSNQIAPANFDIPVEREVSTELFFPDNSRKGFMINCGIQTWGGSASNPKKHYRLEFKAQYGETKLKYDVFEKDDYDATEYKIKPVTKFDKLLLRSGSQDGLNAEYGNENLAQYVRNRVQFDIQMAMGYPAPHGRFVHVFINGQYNGMYHLMERPDEAFFQSYYGYEKEDYEVYKSDSYWNGPFGMFASLGSNIGNLTSQAAIDNANQYIDLDQTAAFLALMCYGSGFDWTDTHNCLGGGHTTPGNVPYKFLLWDVDFSWGNGGRWHPNYAGDPDFFRVPFTQDGQVPDNLPGQLEFRYMMADHMQCECFDDGLLTPSVVDSLYMHRIDQVRTALIAESSIWGNYSFSFGSNHIGVNYWDVFDDFDDETNRIRNSHIPVRTNNMINYWKSQGIYPYTESVNFSNNGGIVNQGHVLTLSNPGNGSIYYTLDGTDPRDVNGYIRNTAIQYTGPITLPNGVVTVKARVRNTNYGRTNINRWSAMCPKTFYVDQDYSSIVINEIMYHQDSLCAANGNDSTEIDYIELHNSGNKTVNLQGCYFNRGIEFEFTETAAIAPGGFLVLAENEQEYFLNYVSFPYGQYKGGLSNDKDHLSLLDPARQVIDSLTYNDNNPWDQDPDGQGPSLELLNPSYDNTDPYNWFRSDNPCGTPGAVNSRVCTSTASTLVINEINYNSDNLNFDPGDWIELHNPNSVAIALDGWELYDNNDVFTFPAGTTIDPGAFLVITENTTLFTSSFPEVNNYLGDLNFTLSSQGDRISLFNPDKCLSDYVVFNDRAPWDTLPDGIGPTLSLIQPGLDNNLPGSWESSSAINTPHGTPGRANEPCPVFVVDIPDTICLEQAALFQVSLIPDSRVEWVFPNAVPATSTNSSVSANFSVTGPMTVELITFYFDCIDTIDININVLQCNGPPITSTDFFTTNEDNSFSGDVSINDTEPNGEAITFSLTSPTSNGTLLFNPAGGFTYTPSLNYNGLDSFVYQACDQSSFCALEQAYITVSPVNDIVIAFPDSYTTDQDTQFQGDVSTNDIDVDDDPLMYTLIKLPTSGNPLFNVNGFFFYTPFAGTSGLDSFIYKVCDGGTPEYCDTATVYINVVPACITLNIAALLEGPYDTLSNSMLTTLNTTRKLLPGMTNNTVSGQPYNVPPWNYNGQEGLNWTDGDYNNDVVDWVLLSFRTGTAKNTEVHRMAGLLFKDGGVLFPDACATVSDLPDASYYVLIEHRNHMGAMSPAPVPIINRTLNLDFRANNSYSNGGTGQKYIPATDKWVLLTGDGDQTADVVSYDINGLDKNLWLIENGIFNQYRGSDFDLNGDVNGDDRGIWLINNGVFSSIPR